MRKVGIPSSGVQRVKIFWYLFSFYKLIILRFLGISLVMVSFSQMRSSIGSNALHCCQRYEARANDISIINSGLVNRYVRCRYLDELISRASALLELIFIRDHSFNLSRWDIQKLIICCPLYAEN